MKESICFDCGVKTSDWVMEMRDQQKVPVCANRHACAYNRLRKKQGTGSAECFLCSKAFIFSLETREEALTNHLKTHDPALVYGTIVRGEPLFRIPASNVTAETDRTS